MSETIEEAAALALAGKLIVIPTDTVYGLATRPDDRAATEKVFEAKGRPHDLDLPVLAPTREDARRIASFDDRAEALASAFWPGPLTIVLRRTAASASWPLGDRPDTIGVRVPRHSMTLAILEAAGPLAATSANRSGEPPLRTCDELSAAFGDKVDLYLCEEGRIRGVASTVVDLAGDELLMIRPGSITEAELRSRAG